MLVVLVAVGGAMAAPVGSGPSGTLRISIISDATLNPFTFPQQIATQMVASTVFDKLTRYRPGDMQTVGDLATSWVPADDGRVWVVKLKRGVRWHDGRPFTAEDVKFTLESIANPNVRALYRSALRGLRRVDVIDEYTARVEYSEPFPSFPVVVGWWIIPMAPKHLLEGKDLNDLSDFAQRPVGTGPFKIKETVKGSHVLVEANPDYAYGPPRLKNIAFKILPDINTVMAQLRAGELDLAQIEAVQRDALANVPHLQFRITEQPSVFFIALNNTRWPFNDRRVRQAMMIGLNRPAIISQIYKGTTPIATGPYPRAFGPYYDKSLQPYPYDANRAKALLAEAGFRPGPDGVLQKDGRPLTFELMVDRGNPVREQIALFAQQSWKEIGANVRIAAEEWSVYIRRGNQLPGDYDARTGWRITAPDPDKTAEYTTTGSNNHYGYSNPEVDRLMLQAREIVDRQKRVPLYYRIQNLIYQDVPVIWINYRTEILAMNKRVKNYPNLMLEDALFWMHLPTVD
jgi:peptide/nickel transport system substrate-binding protein